ncbi:MAG: hypothetical protein JXB36_15580 [Gammaproteobacteria bacterium]|nr:hypothetical protein [Gammaproteobacteria bacterium]
MEKSMTDPTVRFVEEALRAGSSRQEVQRALEEAGWSREHVAKALGAYSDVDFPIPVPRPKSTVSARETFLYLVMFGMLYVSAYNLGQLLLQFINIAFPDPVLDQYAQPLARIRWSVSALLVAFPVFLLIAWWIAKGVARDPTHRASGPRRWLTHLTLAIAACVVATDLIYLLNSMLSGELTARFLLKVLVVAAIAGAIFGYYLWSARADERALAR